jgi:rubrerythrin/ElaB/YqjD/DUF883 family membrane-anchored ribosome-binding protein
VDTQLTGVGGTHAPALQDVLDGLNDLLQLDHDAIAAYDVAIAKLEDRDHADQIAGYRRDHERHVRELNELVARLGGTPANHPHVTGPFKTALQSLGGLAGDKGLLMAFRTNELAVRTKYDSYASRAMLWPPDVKRVIDGAALDEERHYAWVADVLQRMGVGTGELDEASRAADLAREKANVGGGMVSTAKEAVADAAGAVGGAVSGAAGAVGGAVSGAAGSVKDTVAGAAGSVGGAVSGAAGAVGERVSGLAGSVRDGVAGGVGAVRNRIAGLVDTEEGPLAGVSGRVQDAAGGVRSAATGAAETFEGRVREKPLQTLLLAGVAGFVIGRLLR